MKYLIFVFVFTLGLSPLGWSAESKKPKANDHADHAESEEKLHKHGDEEEHDHAEEGHAHKEGETEHGHEEGEKGHAHDEGEEGGGSVGPEKGIISASAEDGIKLAPEALKTFEIKTKKLENAGPWMLPLSARLLAGEETNVYRMRAGSFKRIDFTIQRKESSQMLISSTELKIGDEVVIEGIGFLRIAELAAFGGAPEGHSH